MKRSRNIRWPWEPKITTWKSPYVGQKKKGSYNRRYATALRKARKHRYQDAESWFAEESKGKGMSAVRSDVVLALKNQGYTSADAKRLARSASGSDFDSLFRSALSKAKRNPMPKKKSKKGKMPAGLKAYWAKKRGAKSKARNSRRRRKNPRVKTRTVVRTRTIRKFVYRNPPKRRRRRIAKRQPRRAPLRSVKIPGFLSPKQKKVVQRTIARATGKRVVWK